MQCHLCQKQLFPSVGEVCRWTKCSSWEFRPKSFLAEATTGQSECLRSPLKPNRLWHWNTVQLSSCFRETVVESFPDGKWHFHIPISFTTLNVINHWTQVTRWWNYLCYLVQKFSETEAFLDVRVEDVPRKKEEQVEGGGEKNSETVYELLTYKTNFPVESSKSHCSSHFSVFEEIKHSPFPCILVHIFVFLNPVFPLFPRSPRISARPSPVWSRTGSPPSLPINLSTLMPGFLSLSRSFYIYGWKQKRWTVCCLVPTTTVPSRRRRRRPIHIRTTLAVLRGIMRHFANSVKEPLSLFLIRFGENIWWFT